MKLKAEKISKKFFRNRGGANFFYALGETDFEIESGKLVMIKGRSGSGKTTMLNVLSGLLEPSSGKVFIDDADIYAMSDKELSRLRNVKIGVIPQGSTALHNLTVIENVIFPATMYSKADDKIEQKAKELLAQVGIADLAEAMPSELSGGEMRRMAIARALINNPGFILADEPTGDLDDENTAAVLGMLRKTAENGTAVLVVTHEPEAEKYADEVYRMNAGTLEKQ